MATAIYLLNRAPTKVVDGMTPYEAWHGQKPAVQHLRTFGYVASRSSRTMPSQWSSSATNRVPRRGASTIRCRDAIFNEQASWSWQDEGEDMRQGSEIIVDLMEDEPDAALMTPATPPAASASRTPAPQVEFMAPPTDDMEEFLDADNDDDFQPRYRTLDNIYATTPTYVLYAHEVAPQLHLQIEEEPTNFAKADESEPWRQAMKEEMDSIESN